MVHSQPHEAYVLYLCLNVCVWVFLYHHKFKADGQEDVSDGQHRLISRDGQSQGRGCVRHQNDGEHEDEERLGRWLQSCTGNIKHQTACSISEEHEWWDEDEDVCLTDHPVHHAAEDDGRDCTQKQDVRQDLGQEVHRDSVVSADVLVPEDTPTTTSSSINQSKILITINQHCNCTENTTGRILKDKLILSWYFLLNFLFLEKKRIFCIPEKCLLTQNLRIIKIIENNL